MGIEMVAKDKNDTREYIMDIRQIRFWEEYLNPKGETYGNAYKSALKAGYSDGHAASITTQKFFKKKMRRLNMLAKAEKVLDKTLTMKTKGADGKEQADLLRIQVDAAKHITKTLGKDEGYSERSEITGKDGEEIRVSEIVFNAPVVNPKSNED